MTPGFVDLHSHLDAQIGWDPLMSSSCWHGVTSVVMGNCGMTFAPIRPGQDGVDQVHQPLHSAAGDRGMATSSMLAILKDTLFDPFPALSTPLS